VNVKQRRRNLEKTKTLSDHLDSLLAEHEKLEDNLVAIKTYFNKLFKLAFVHRYRDDNPQIRAICIEICIWFKQFPKHFLDDSYFTYSHP
jgi:cohesin complex subunit SA-1/2